MSEMIETFDDQSFEREISDSALPVLVDFWAEWCRPCIAMVPDLEAVAKMYSGKLRVAKLQRGEVGVEDYTVKGAVEFLAILRQAGVTLPIFPGILPITDYEKLLNFCRLCGAMVSQSVRRTFEPIRTLLKKRPRADMKGFKLICD